MAARIGVASNWRLVAGAVGIGLAAVVAILVAVRSSESERTGTPSKQSSVRHDKVQQGISPELRDFMAIFDEAKPLFPGGTETTLGDAPSLSGFPVYQPKAVVETAPEVWLSEESREVGLRYGSDLVLLEVPWPAGKEPTVTYEEQAKQWEAGYTTTINGRPAWVIPADSRAPEQPPVNVVHVAIDGVDVTLYGRMKIDDLVSIAGTLEA